MTSAFPQVRSRFLRVFRAVVDSPAQYAFPNALNTWSHAVDVDGRRVNLSIWDASSYLRQELRTLSYYDKHVVLFCYDSTREDTLVSILDKVHILHPLSPIMLISRAVDAGGAARTTRRTLYPRIMQIRRETNSSRCDFGEELAVYFFLASLILDPLTDGRVGAKRTRTRIRRLQCKDTIRGRRGLRARGAAWG